MKNIKDEIEDLRTEILSLIDSKTEGDYWDFKEYHHENKANLIHDIICMANNRADRDAYIIFGVRDSDYSIVGVNNDTARRNQQQMIQELKDKKFAGGIKPTIYLKILKVKNVEIDVLIIKNSTDTPFFLEENIKYENTKGKVKTVFANHIYTRVGDTNTDINKSADIDKQEYLWKKRFLLNKSPLEQIIKKLDNKEEWINEEDMYYNKYNPGYTVNLIHDDDDYIKSYEYYSYAMCNEKTSYGKFEIKSYGTMLYSNQFVILDSGRYITSVPKLETIRFNNYNENETYYLKYFVKNEIDYKIHKFLYKEYNEEATYAYNRFMEVVLVFENEVDKESFINYIHENKKSFELEVEKLKGSYSYISCENNNEKKEVIKRLNVNKVANEMLKKYREN